MGQLVLLRHGESQWNLENRFTGWVDVPLSPKGEQEALQAGEKLKALGIHLAQTPPRPLASSATRAGTARCTLSFRLLGRNRAQGRKGRLQKFQTALACLQRLLCLKYRGADSLRGLDSGFKETPVKSESKGNRNQKQNKIAGGVDGVERYAELPGEQRIQNVDDHALKHEHGESDSELDGYSDIARARSNKLQHSGVRRNPGQRA